MFLCSRLEMEECREVSIVNVIYEKKEAIYRCEKRILGKPATYRHVMQKKRTGKESTLGSLETTQVKQKERLLEASKTNSSKKLK